MACFSTTTLCSHLTHNFLYMQNYVALLLVTFQITTQSIQDDANLLFKS